MDLQINVIQMEIGGAVQAAVSLRELHKGLQIRKDFTNWSKAQIKRGRFDESEYLVLAHEVARPLIGLPSREYYCTLEMAKSIAAMSATKLGDAYRRYLIRVEKLASDAQIVGLQAERDRLIAQVGSLHADLAKALTGPDAAELDALRRTVLANARRECLRIRLSARAGSA